MAECILLFKWQDVKNMGMIVDVAKDSFDVKTKDGLLRVYEVQLEGKKRMRCDAFLRGFSLEKGQQLKSSRE